MNDSHTANTFRFRRNRSEIITVLWWKSLTITILLVFSHSKFRTFSTQWHWMMHRCERGSKFNVHWFSGSFCCLSNFSASFSTAFHCQGFCCSQMTSITTLCSSVKPVSPAPLYMHFIVKWVFEPHGGWTVSKSNHELIGCEARWKKVLQVRMWQYPRKQPETYRCTEIHHSATFLKKTKKLF